MIKNLINVCIKTQKPYTLINIQLIKNMYLTRYYITYRFKILIQSYYLGYILADFINSIIQTYVANMSHICQFKLCVVIHFIHLSSFLIRTTVEVGKCSVSHICPFKLCVVDTKIYVQQIPRYMICIYCYMVIHFILFSQGGFVHSNYVQQIPRYMICIYCYMVIHFILFSQERLMTKIYDLHILLYV